MLIVKKPMLKKHLILKDGWKRKKITVELYLDDIAARYASAMIGLGKTEIALRKDGSAENMESYGRAVITVFNLFFGEKNTNEILDFYENRYLSMLTDIYPFLEKEVIPCIESPVEKAKKSREAV